MKIAQIGCYPLSPNCINGGIEASVYGLAKEQSKQHEVVCFDYPRLDISDYIEEVACIRVYRYKNPGNKQKDMTKCLEAMVLNILDEQPDICHIHGTGLLSKLLYERLQHAQVRLMLTIRLQNDLEEPMIYGIYRLCVSIAIEARVRILVVWM